MTIPVANIDISTDTFGTWVARTNSLTHITTNHAVTVDGTSTGNSSSGNGTVIGRFGANTLFATTALRGGNVATSDTLTISSNLSVTNTATISGATTLSDTLTVTGLTTLNGSVNTPTANATTAVNVGANVALNTSSLRVSNSISNTVITVAGLNIAGSSTVNTVITSTIISISNSSSTANITASEMRVGNTRANTTFVRADNGYFSSNLTVDGTFTITTAAESNGNFMPVLTGTYSLGNTSRVWSAVHANSIFGTTVNAATFSVGSTVVANTLGITTSGNVNISATGELVVAPGAGIFANGSLGTATHVLHSNGTSIYWDVDNDGVTSVASGNGMTGGTITTTGTVSILANTGIVANATGTHVNAAYIATIAANSATGSLTNTFTVGTASYFVANGNLGIGTANPTYELTVDRGSLSSTSGERANVLQLTTTTTNADTLNFAKVREATGSDWQTAAWRIQQVVDTTSQGYIQFNGNNASDTLSFGTTNTERVRIAANGNVGIGNTVPAHRLRVEGILSLSSGLHANGELGTAGQVLHSNGSSTYWAADDGGVTSVTAGSGLTGGTITTSGTISILANSGIVSNSTGVFVNANNGIFTSAAGVFVLANNGIVANSTGVFVNANNGITANTTGIFVNANNGIIANTTGVFVNANSGIVANTNGVFVNTAFIGTLTANNANNLNGQAAAFYTNATNLSTGTVSTDRLAGTYSINVSGSAGTAGNASNLNGQAASFYTDIPARLGYTPVNRAGDTGLTGSYTTTGAEISIGSGQNEQKRLRFQNASRNVFLYLDPTSALFGLWDTGLAASRWTTDASGNFTSTGNVTAYSDVRLKVNIHTIENALDTVNKLRGVTYDRLDGTKHLGVVAQEVKEVLPEVVLEDDNGMLSVAYGNMVGLLIEAVKELTTEVKTLRAKVDMLEGRE